MDDVREAGVGVVFFSDFLGFHDIFEGIALEIEPQTYWRDPASDLHPAFNEGLLRTIADRPNHKLIHSVGLPVGGSLPPPEEHVAILAANVEMLDPPYVSEHLSFNTRMRNGIREWAGFLLPPLQTPAGVAVAVERIRNLRASLNRPLAFETGVNYFAPSRSEMRDGEFFAAIAHEADCGILLDLHNVYTNERNGRSTVQSVLDDLPLDRVWEIHVAGGHVFRDFYLDAHCGLVSEELRRLTERVVPLLPNLRALVFEANPDSLRSVGVDALREQFDWMHSVWSRRGSCAIAAAGRPARPALPALEEALVQTAQWEDAVWKRIKRPAADDESGSLLGELIYEARGGSVLKGARLTARLLLATLGSRGFRELFETFCAQHRAQMFPASESAQFLTFAAEHGGDVEHLNEIVSFEQSLHRVIATQSPQEAHFSCDPAELFEALLRRERPRVSGGGAYTVRIHPDRVEVVSG